MTITVVAPTTSKSVVVIDSFTVVEFQYPSAPGQWYYAPLVRLKETTGLHGASVIGVDFSIPGFGPAPKCRAGLYLGPGESADLFHEIYGDYQLEYSNGGARATGSEATALITVQDDAGVVALLTALGPIVPGRLPTTYTGGNPVNHLACGP